MKDEWVYMIKVCEVMSKMKCDLKGIDKYLLHINIGLNATEEHRSL